MGYSMAQIFAKYNYDVTIYDLKAEAIENAKKRIKENTQILIRDQELTSEQEKLLINILNTQQIKNVLKIVILLSKALLKKLKSNKVFINKFQD